MRTLFILIMIALLLAGCGAAVTPSSATLSASTPNVASAATATPAVTLAPAQIDLVITPQPPKVGDATLNVTVTHGQQPLAGVQVAVRGDMTHAGMAPVLGSAKTDAQGKMSLPFKWSMAGDWIVTITVTLADNSQVAQDFNVTVQP